MMPLVVLGRSGQVAQELARLAPGAAFLGSAEADLAHPEAAIETIAGALEATGARAVINAAAYTAVDRAETEEGAALTLNAIAPAAVARLCATRGLPLVHISTDYVFDGSGTRAVAIRNTMWKTWKSC